jgi:hypothetical protein
VTPAERRALAPPPPRIRLSIGVTGHREGNPSFDRNRSAIEAQLLRILDTIDAAIGANLPPMGPAEPAASRMHCLLADGVDQMAARQALARAWELVVPLPFGRALNAAINARPETVGETQWLLTGQGNCSPATRVRAHGIQALLDQARVFELADRDEEISELYLAHLAGPGDLQTAQTYSFRLSERVTLAAQVMIEQSDFLVAVWDGASTSLVGGTGHTLVRSLEMGSPVVWIDAREPERWHVLHAPESLAVAMIGRALDSDREEALVQLVREGVYPSPAGKGDDGYDGMAGFRSLDAEPWRAKSTAFWHGYRRVEALAGTESARDRFRDLTQVYEDPDEIVTGSGAYVLDAAAGLPGQSSAFVDRIRVDVLRRFAWADGISARLSDTYRGGMVLNFGFSALAIVGGIAYLPAAASHQKWIFALFELGLLSAILTITAVGRSRRWHGRWFQTRRVAEYLRHAPILLLLGVARPASHWPRGAETSWPEGYARHAMRDLGLPAIAVTLGYLRGVLIDLMRVHVVRQRDYHLLKARRLARAHHRLDALSGGLFSLAVMSVSAYLLLKAGGALHLIDKEVAARNSLLFTFLGVALPTFGAAISGVRYFGDFERFSAISAVTAKKLQAVASRIELLIFVPEASLDYAQVSELAHAVDDIVVSEIENWQAVFGGKHITVPV